MPAPDEPSTANDLKGKLPSAFSLFSKSSEIVQKNLKLYVIIYILPFASAITTMANRTHTRYDGRFAVPTLSVTEIGGLLGLGLIFTVALVVLMVFVQAFAYALQVETAKGKQPTFDDIWAMAVKYWTRLFMLGIRVALRVIGGFFLLIVPGVRAIRKYFLAPYHMIDGDLSVKEALDQSEAASERDPGAIWGVIGVGILLSFTGVFPLIGGLISLVLTALYSAAPALRYLEMKR